MLFACSQTGSSAQSACDQSLCRRQQWFPTVCRLLELSQHHSTRHGRQSARTRTLGQDFLVWAQRGRKSDTSSHRHTQVSVSGVRLPWNTFLFMWELQMSNLFTDGSFWLLWCELLPAVASNVRSDGTKCWDNMLPSRMHFKNYSSCILIELLKDDQLYFVMNLYRAENTGELSLLILCQFKTNCMQELKCLGLKKKNYD